MGHAAGQLADGLHLLRLAQLLLELALLGDVGGRADQALHLAGLVAQGEGAVADPAHRAVGPHDAIDLVVVAAPRPRVAACSTRSRSSGCTDSIHSRRRLVEAAAGSAPDRLEGRADIEHLALPRAGHPEDLLDGLGELAEALFALAEVGLRAPPFRDVLDLPDEMGRLAVIVPDERRAQQNPARIRVSSRSIGRIEKNREQGATGCAAIL